MRKPIKTKPDSQTKYCFKGKHVCKWSLNTGELRKRTI